MLSKISSIRVSTMANSIAATPRWRCRDARRGTCRARMSAPRSGGQAAQPHGGARVQLRRHDGPLNERKIRNQWLGAIGIADHHLYPFGVVRRYQAAAVAAVGVAQTPVAAADRDRQRLSGDRGDPVGALQRDIARRVGAQLHVRGAGLPLQGLARRILRSQVQRLLGREYHSVHHDAVEHQEKRQEDQRELHSIGATLSAPNARYVAYGTWRRRCGSARQRETARY